MFMRVLLFAAFLSLSACAGGVATAPDESNCDFFGNCKCTDWYGNCSGHS